MTLDPQFSLFPDAIFIRGYLGGTMIGIAAAIMLLGLGRIAGVSGLLARTTGLAESGVQRRVAGAFTIGLPIGALLYAAIMKPTPIEYPSSILMLVIGGTIVGFGTRLGSGCTSGHGVCGVSRLSRRSLIATGLFMVSGIAMVTLMRHLGVAW